MIGNSQLVHFTLQDNRLLKKKYKDVAKAYNEDPAKFDLNDNTGKLVYEHGERCGRLIRAAYISLGGPIKDFSINEKHKDNQLKYFNCNTNKKCAMFPNGKRDKGFRLFLLHTLSVVNFVLYVLRPIENDDTGWWGKTYYIAYYYAVRKLQDLYNYLKQNNKMTKQIEEYYRRLPLDGSNYMNSDFRNYSMHSMLLNKNNEPMISEEYLNPMIPLFGLVETCFDGLSYKEFKGMIIKESETISEVLEEWLECDGLEFKL